MSGDSDRVLVAAAEEFAASGYDGATVRGIAARCGMSTGSLFHKYANKRELLVAVVAEGTIRAYRHVSESLEGVTDPWQRLRALVTAHLETIHDDDKAFTVTASREFYLLDDGERQSVVTVRDRYEELWQSILDEAAAAGHLPYDPLLRLFLLGAVNHTILWFTPSAGLSIAELGERFVGLVADGPAPAALAGADTMASSRRSR